MSKETLEHLSSLMDGELSRETGLFLTRRLSTDQELSQAWRRYHLIRDCIRQPGGRVPLVDIAQSMKNAMGEETLATPVAAGRNRWLRPVSGLAIAATVAFMAVIAIGPGQREATDVAPEQAALPSFSSPNVKTESPLTQAASFNPAEQVGNARLNSYLLRHNQLSGSTGRQGFVFFVPIISATSDTEPETPEPDDSAEASQDDTPSTP
ncbi:MAG TPA: sigma-E factor negative regulatory protein [Xanthomonadales bacterium]|nr:sigma-E factor negative regulatory protein [Xanthomonadales bacterium]